MHLSIKHINYQTPFILLGASIILGFFFRINGLGNGGFSNSDEYYIAKSVHHILEYGVPAYPLGGYYTRGLIYQYLSALLIIITGINDEFALRIIPLIFNLLAIPALYLLGKKVGGKIIGGSIVFLFCFSTLEIEYARLARYYTPFQTLFIWYIYFLINVVIEKKASHFKWLLIISTAGIFMYEGGIFLTLLNFIPFIWIKEKPNVSKILYSIIIFCTAIVYLKIDFRNYGVINYLPTDVKIPVENGIAPIDLPHLFIQTVSSPILYSLFFILVAISIFYGAFLINSTIEKRTKLIFLLAVLLSLFNLFGLIFVSLIIFYLIGWIKHEEIKSKAFYLLLIVLSLNFISYFIFALNTNSWLRYFPEESSILINKIIWILVNYPNFYEKLLIPWFSSLPILTTTIFSSFIIYLIINFIKSPTADRHSIEGTNFLLSTVIVLISLVAILKTPYNDVRYTFFIYPILVLLFLFSIKYISESIFNKSTKSIIVYSSFFIFFVLFSSDYNANHLLKIGSNEVRYRTIYQPAQENIYYYQEDYISPATKINKNLSAGDLVVTTQAPIEYYLKRLDYKYLDFRDMEFSIRSRNNGHKEVWTNANLIYKEDDFLNLLKHSKSTIWLSDFSDKRPGVSQLEKKINSEFSQHLFYVNFDSTINVFKIPPMK